MVAWWNSFAFRFVAVYSTSVFVVAFLGLTALYKREKAEVEGKFGLVLEAIAKTIAPQIDGSLLDDIRSNADANTPAFQSVRDILHRVKHENYLADDQVYILRPNKKDQFEFVVMLQKKTFVGDPYSPPQVVADAYSFVLSQSKGVRTPLYTDAHGTFISGLAPIPRPDGSVAGILHVDYDIEKFLEEVESTLKLYASGLGLLCLFFITFGVYMHRRLAKDVTTLLEGTRAIEHENYGFVVKINRRDELGILGIGLNRALHGLGERFEMLKFLPRHTVRMIEEAAARGGVQRADGARIEAAVFTSDIRGFTDLSEQWSAEKVVRMLNEFICVQAEIIAKHDGSIDKYMGDAVLAVFEGADKEYRALQAAIEIQSAIADLNANEAAEKPILVGIGITVGELVMGNMGSDERMEYTVIGSPVNLSSRLCSKADGGTTIVSEDVYAKTQPLRSYVAFSGPESHAVKGFDQPVTVYSLHTKTAA